jgi:hypothetical protein
MESRGAWDVDHAGPYRAGGGAADPAVRAAHLKLLNAAAVALHRAGHMPIIGVNMALPMIEAAGGADAAYEEIMAPLSPSLSAATPACGWAARRRARTTRCGGSRPPVALSIGR